MPGHGVSAPESLSTPERTDARRITNVSRPTLTLFPAPKKDAPPPAMIVCPGGGYNYVVIDKEGTEIATWLNSNGISALVLKYRVPNNRDGALQDLQRALSLARAQAKGWDITPKRLGVIGFSAGGNLAAKASARFDERSYSMVDVFDQQSCRPDFALLVYPAYLDDRNGHVATDLNLKADIPPTLIVHNEDDKTFVAGSKLYHAALDEAKIPNEFLLYPSGGHGYGLRSTNGVRAWPQDAMEWLHKGGIISMAAFALPPSATRSTTHGADTPPLRIAIIGDSTVCDYPKSRPERGWGQFIEERFRPGAVRVLNLAASGRSTKTFIQEGRWKKTLEQKPNYVLIQFGHNDSHEPERPESTDAATTYKDYLRRYIDESRAIQATPILVTPMVRRTFAADGQLKDALQPYADAMKEVGVEKNVPMIDLHASSKKLVQQLGPEASAAMANKQGDATHFNEKGARAMADLVMQELPTAAPNLKAFVRAPPPQ
jgi:lysophospholipase L1-like esterase